MIGRGTIAGHSFAVSPKRRRSAAALTFAALLLVLATGLAARPAHGEGEGPVSVTIIEDLFRFDAGLGSKRLSRTMPTPVKVLLEARSIRPSAPVGIKSLDLDLDRHLGLDTARLPLGARVATGTARVIVAIPGNTVAGIPVKGDLAVYNRGDRPGGAVLRLVLSLPAPLDETVSTRILIRDLNGRDSGGLFGSRATIAIPRLDGGYAELVGFRLIFPKRVRIESRAVPDLTAICEDGKIAIAFRARLSDGYGSRAEVVRACTPRP